MEETRTSPTIADVAHLAGVSHQTVSRVLNNHPSVSTKTHHKVSQAIASLGYRRNLAARTLATGTSRVIGVLVTRTHLSGPSAALLAIEQTARLGGYWVSMAGLQRNDPKEVTEVISHFIDQGVDGIIAVAQTETAVEATLQASGSMPTVLVTSGAVPPDRFSVDIDQGEGADQAMTILKGLRHSSIAHISGPHDDLHASVRAESWRRALPAGQDPNGLLIEGDWTSQSGYGAAMTLLANKTLPTAIFAGNDTMGFGVLRALHDRGIGVPGGISVVGFDDIAGADCSIPPLTTIHQDHHGLGQASMELLLEAIAGHEARSMKIPTQLIVRASTGVPA
ncbi:MAG: LacI family transcriptional regulator [Propionibacteriaceae bacterium]|nr:LacI family transcriptional regulator [Propionibacteriaceae bacterium]